MAVSNATEEKETSGFLGRLIHAIFVEGIAGGKFARWLMLFSGGVGFILMVGNAVMIITRKLIHWSPPGIFEYTSESMMILFTFPLAYLAITRGHLFFEAMNDKVPKKVQDVLDILGACLGAVLFTGVGWAAGVQGIQGFEKGEYQQGLINIPIWPFRLLLSFGLLLFTIHLVAYVVVNIRKLSAGNR